MPFRATQEPWLPPGDQAVATPTTGRAFVVLPTARDPNARARVMGTIHGLARLGPTGESDNELWELPVVWTPTTRSTLPHVLVELLSAARRESLTIPVLQPPELPVEEAIADADDVVPANNASFDEVLDHHVEAVRHWLDGGEEQSAHLIGRASGKTLLPLHEFCERYWQLEDRIEAPLTLIVRIATEVGPLVEEVAGSPRRVLSRDRRLVPLGRAQEIDASCLRWLTRQPGSSLSQRAGPRQMVRAVVRDPSIDTLENRVLRHFLELCRVAASKYRHNYYQHHCSPRWAAVERLRIMVDRLLRQAPIGRVGQMARIPEPNYVLQFDARYSTIWTWYVRLVRQEQEKDDLRSWHQRVWAERCTTAVLSTLERECGRLHSSRGQLALRHEAQEGSFFSGASSLGPWVFPRTPKQHVVRILRRSQVRRLASVAALSRLAFDFVLVRQDPFDATEISAALAVFTLFTPDDQDRDLLDRLERLDRVLPFADWEVPGALVLTPHTAGTQVLQRSRTRNVVGCRLPMPTSQDKSAVEALRGFLRNFAEPGA